MIYFIADKNNQYIKIGYTKNLKNRINNLQTSNPLELYTYKTIIGNREDEKSLHTKFSFCW